MSSKKKADVNKFKVVFGYTLLFISIILFTSFISYMYNWRIDQSSVDSILDRDIKVENILGKIGASISHLLIFKLFGIASFILPVILLISSYYLLFNKKILELIKKVNWLLLLIIWTTLLSGYLLDKYTEAALPFLDALTTWGAIIATYMVAKKLIENWIYWFVIDSISIFLFISRDLNLTALLFTGYLVIIFFGYRSWSKARK